MSNVKNNLQEIINLYNSGLSAEKIAKQFGSKAQTITKYLIKNGVEIRGPAKKLTEDDKVNICDLYLAGESSIKIAKTFNVSNAVILRILNKNNIDRRSAEEAHRKYKINELFFDKIDSEEKAYFLGLLYADGCNHKRNNYVNIALEVADKELLIKLAELIYVDNPEEHVKTYDRSAENKGVTASLNINSKHICHKLAELGCDEVKTFKIKYPEWLDESLHRHFIRGYFDGDGCLYVNDRKGEGSHFKLTSNIDFVKGMHKIIEDNLSLRCGIYKSTKNSKVFDLMLAGDRQVKKIMDWLYLDSTLYMERKYQKYQQLIIEINKTNELIKLGTRGYPKVYLNK